MLVLQALVEGAVLEAHPTGRVSTDNDHTPYLELYTQSQHSSDVSSIQICLVSAGMVNVFFTVSYYRVKHSLTENWSTKVLLFGGKCNQKCRHQCQCHHCQLKVTPNLSKMMKKTQKVISQVFPSH